MSNFDAKTVWAEALRELSSSMSPSTFSTWVKPLTLQSMQPVGPDRAIANLTAESPYVAQQAEMRCYAQLKQVIDKASGVLCDLTFSQSSASESASQEMMSNQEPQPQLEPFAPSVSHHQPASSVTLIEKLENSSVFAGTSHAGQGQPHNYRNDRYANPPPAQPQQYHQSYSANNAYRAAPTPMQPPASRQATPLSLFSTQPSGGVVLPTVDRYKLALQKAHLREDHTFDTFAVSGSNEMAYAAASAVAQTPGQVYNPLFLWGGVGVGKTHLMQSIGNVILKNNPEVAITYCMGEEFLNEIIAAIRNKKTMEFKERYRQLKVLLIDDIQFIAGKDTAQEEFFHTFNAITRAGGQIIMTSDRPPHEIHPLEDRLRSRFEGGLTIDIQQPTFELRTAILLIKAQKLALELPMNLAQIIASEVESTRKLEGVVFKLHSAHRFQNKPLDENLVRMVLGQESKPVITKQNVKPSAIIRAVTSHFHVSANTLRGESRKKDYVLARHIAMFLMKSELDIPFAEIGHTFGGRDHSSVMHACQKIEKEMKENSTINQHISAIRISLSSL